MRKTEVVVVPSDPKYGRDREPTSKHFLLTEWPAARAEEWAIRAILAYNRGGVDINLDRALGMGMRAIAIFGIQTFLRGQMRAEEIVPILNELLECVKIIRDPSARDKETGEPVATPIVSDDDIEEVATRLWLRSEVIRLHTGFSPGDALSHLVSLIMTPEGVSPSTETSPPA
jgi:hypothetical protein